MMVWYLVPSLDPELLVAVSWEPGLGSFVGRVQGLATTTRPDPDSSTVAWFGSRPHQLPTVQDLQDAIGHHGVLGTKARAALEADQAGHPPPPTAGRTRQLGGSTPALAPRSTGRRTRLAARHRCGRRSRSGSAAAGAGSCGHAPGRAEAAQTLSATLPPGVRTVLAT